MITRENLAAAFEKLQVNAQQQLESHRQVPVPVELQAAATARPEQADLDGVAAQFMRDMKRLLGSI